MCPIYNSKNSKTGWFWNKDKDFRSIGQEENAEKEQDLPLRGRSPDSMSEDTDSDLSTVEQTGSDVETPKVTDNRGSRELPISKNQLRAKAEAASQGKQMTVEEAQLLIKQKEGKIGELGASKSDLQERAKAAKLMAEYRDILKRTSSSDTDDEVEEHDDKGDQFSNN